MLIQKTSNVCGGDACVRQTRIPVWLLEAMRIMGASDLKLLKAYPQLNQADLDAVWEYVLKNSDEIHKCLQLDDRTV